MWSELTGPANPGALSVVAAFPEVVLPGQVSLVFARDRHTDTVF